MALKRMDNIGIVVDDLEGAIDFFRELGLELEGRTMIEGEWAGRVTGLGDQRVEIAMMRAPDGHSRLELSRFLVPAARRTLQPCSIRCTKSTRPEGVRRAFLWTFIRGAPLKVGWLRNPSFSVPPRMNNFHSFDS